MRFDAEGERKRGREAKRILEGKQSSCNNGTGNNRHNGHSPTDILIHRRINGKWLMLCLCTELNGKWHCHSAQSSATLRFIDFNCPFALPCAHWRLSSPLLSLPCRSSLSLFVVERSNSIGTIAISLAGRRVIDSIASG